MTDKMPERVWMTHDGVSRTCKPTKDCAVTEYIRADLVPNVAISKTETTTVTDDALIKAYDRGFEDGRNKMPDTLKHDGAGTDLLHLPEIGKKEPHVYIRKDIYDAMRESHDRLLEALTLVMDLEEEKGRKYGTTWEVCHTSIEQAEKVK